MCPCATGALRRHRECILRPTIATTPRGTSSPRATEPETMEAVAASATGSSAAEAAAAPLRQLARQAAVDRRRLEREPFPMRTRGKDALAGQQHLAGHLASERETKGEGGCGDDGRAVESGAQGPAEVAVADGVWGGGVVRPAHGLVAKSPLDDSHYVVTVDPGHPLFAASQRSSGAELERQQHLRECAAVRGEHD